jgi:hypothetical protein
MDIVRIRSLAWQPYFIDIDDFIHFFKKTTYFKATFFA